MRYIGNKENLLDKIYNVMICREIRGNTFFDFFSGTTNVARFFKKKGFQVFSSDLLYFSYVLQKAYIANNQELTFDKLLKNIVSQTNSLFATPLQRVVEYLNQIPDKQGFIYKNYTPAGNRMYYSEENGLRIDAIR
jgi:adenine-specific DNA-methyltransferase